MYGRLSKSFQYLYLMRFSLLLWLFPLVFALLDSGWLSLSTTTLSRGIFVPEYFSGFLCVAFFVIATGCVALVTARAVVINGAQRFAPKCPACVEAALVTSVECMEENRTLNAPPAWLEQFLADKNSNGETAAVLVALIPSVLTFAYLVWCGIVEGVPPCRILTGLLCGTVMAAAFWYVVNAFYYFAYAPPPQPGEVLTLGDTAARTMLFPRHWFWLRKPGTRLDRTNRTLEDVETTLATGKLRQKLQRLLIWLQAKIGMIGYVYPDGRLYEAHLFALVAALGFFVLFWVLYPLTAPEPNDASVAAAAVVLIGLVWVTAVIARGEIPDATPKELKLLRVSKAILIGFACLFCFSILALWLFTDPERFPTLASILLALIIVAWILGALAFWLDRHRVPVLTFGILLAVSPRLLHLYDFGGAEEHFVSTTPRASADRLPTPAEILDKHLAAADVKDGQNHYPLIIVTATGGGLHASAWTTRVLRQLYLQLAPTQPQLITDHILLMSTVSGGSVGLNYFLQAINTKPGPPDWNKMVVDGQCSGLEAVGWGLIYYDGTRAIVPLAPYVLWRSGGDADLEGTPIFKDRTWALRKAFERNADDAYCWDSARTAFPKELDMQANKPSDEEKKLLYRPWYQRLLPTSTRPQPQLTVGGLQAGVDFPAFTMNTTTVEAGNRFLLANYRVPTYRVGPIEGLPAESFVDVFQQDTESLKKCGSRQPDLPLVSAAQMSATFPYVSSATRIPEQCTWYSEHFVDGGYYDDDGTSSAIEFLRYALDEPEPGSHDVDPQDETAKQDIGNRGPIDILLIEIRNSADIDNPQYQPHPVVTKQGKPASPKSWKHSGLLQQLGFPLEGFWNAGHGSVTGRDRNGLDLLFQSHGTNLHLHQIIFDDQPTSEKHHGIHSAPDPLSWSLTPNERAEVARSADPGKDGKGRMGNCYRNAAGWFNHFDDLYKSSSKEPTRCIAPPQNP